jgi:hypothetical protein
MLHFSLYLATSLLSESSLILKQSLYFSRIWLGDWAGSFSRASPTSPAWRVNILNSWLSTIKPNLEHSRINLSRRDLLSSMKPGSLSPSIYFSGMQGMKQPGHLSVKVTCKMWNSLYLRTTSNLPCESYPVTVYFTTLPKLVGLVTEKRWVLFSSSSNPALFAEATASEILLN